MPNSSGHREDLRPPSGYRVEDLVEDPFVGGLTQLVGARQHHKLVSLDVRGILFQDLWLQILQISHEGTSGQTCRETRLTTVPLLIARVDKLKDCRGWRGGSDPPCVLPTTESPARSDYILGRFFRRWFWPRSKGSVAVSTQDSNHLKLPPP